MTPSRRFATTLTNDELTTDKPHKPLTQIKLRTGGRRNSGDTTIWHRGGGHKRKLRIIDFKRDKVGVPGKVVSIEYDPNRSARIALIAYLDGDKRYILQPTGLQVGQKIVSGPEADILVGNALPLRNIPAGTTVHNVELKPGKGAQMVRSAGGAAQLVAKEDDYALVKLPSGEVADNSVLKGVMVELGNGQKLPAHYGPHGTQPTDYFWSLHWVIPGDYPTGSIGYKLAAVADKAADSLKRETRDRLGVTGESGQGSAGGEGAAGQGPVSQGRTSRSGTSQSGTSQSGRR